MIEHTPEGLTNNDEYSPELAHSTIKTMPDRQNIALERVTGMLLGIAIGDAMGLPLETMTATDIAARFGRVETLLSCVSNPFIKGELPLGTISDDTQLTIAVARALIAANRIDLDQVARAHIEAYDQTTRGWGESTRRGIARLKAGQDPRTPNPYGMGTGNGVAMKIAPIAYYLACHTKQIEDHLDSIVAITAITHPTSIAVSSALAQIAAVQYCLTNSPDSFSRADFLATVIRYSKIGEQYFPETLGPDNLTAALTSVATTNELSVDDLVQKFGGGSCYVFHSLPFSYAFFIRDPNSVQSLFEVINAGGDTDSNGSMVGALLGALNGSTIFPAELVEQISRTTTVNQVATQLFEALLPQAI